MCEACGAVQKATDPSWKADADSIYRDYEIYIQAGGAEQSVFDAANGTAIERSRALLQRVEREITFADKGRMLDVGCGNGALLKSFGTLRPHWSMTGTEWDGRNRAKVEAIPLVEALHVGDPSEVPGDFDLIALVHVLEHIAAPREYLEGLGSKLASGGNLLIQVPDFRSNPFDLMIADHCTHFGVDTLTRLLTDAGFHISHVGEGWIAKELTVIAVLRTNVGRNDNGFKPQGSFHDARESIAWLSDFSGQAKKAALKGPVAIFGTSIAATWLFGELDGKAEFFIDEDPNRIGGTHLGRPVRAPDDAASGVTVLLALMPAVAKPVSERLAALGMSAVAPPELPWN